MNFFLIGFLLAHSGTVERAVQDAQNSGRVLLLSDTDAERLGSTGRVPPGVPPVLSFRYMEGARRHRFGDLGLVVDDAGH